MENNSYLDKVLGLVQGWEYSIILFLIFLLLICIAIIIFGLHFLAKTRKELRRSLLNSEGQIQDVDNLLSSIEAVSQETPIGVSSILTTKDERVKPEDVIHDEVIRNDECLAQNISTSPDALHHLQIGNGIPDIAGIDKKIGLTITQGDMVLYRKLLEKFSHKYTDSLSKLKDAEAEEDSSAALRFVHTLKSSSGSVGATGVQKAALALEEAYDGGASQGEICSLQADLDIQLAPVLGGIADMMLSDVIAVEPSLKGGAESFLCDSQLEEVLNRLKKGDANAADTIDSLLKLNLSSTCSELLNEAYQSACEYDYVTAAEAVGKLRDIYRNT